MPKPRHDANLTDAWFAAGGALRTVVPSARLNVSGTGIDMDIRPGLHQHDLLAIRRWLALTMPRLTLRPGHTVEYDRLNSTRRG